MDNVVIQKQNLTDIANAIRERNGLEDTYKPNEMAEAIINIPAGAVLEPLVLTGNCENKCSGFFANYYIQKYGDTITTKDITYATGMFIGYEGDKIPFEINFVPNKNYGIAEMCKQSMIKEAPIINNFKFGAITGIFNGCWYLKDGVDRFFDSFTGWESYSSSGAMRTEGMFNGCYSLRSIPTHYFTNFSKNTGYASSYFNNGFNECYAIDELVDLPVPYTSATWTSNAFNSTFSWCLRIKDITFETPNGNPVVVKWKNQTIDFSNFTGHTPEAEYFNDCICNWNSGITANKKVYDAESYNRLKNDKDWYSTGDVFARYDMGSASRTIYSLPDASAYLATQTSGANTIKFLGCAGSGTDAGAISNLPEAVIANAVAKGWTVSIV